MAAIPDIVDPTLSAIDRELERRAAGEPRRTYLGASSLGQPCERAVWYATQPAIPTEPRSAYLIRCAEDGHRTEELVIERLRMVPGITVWNRDEQGQQYGFTDFEGRFKGHIDGIVSGLYQAPATPHILEVKCCNETKFKAFLASKEKFGEKDALANWDATFWAQAALYMYYFDLTRHYLIVATPGGRQIASCRTNANNSFAQALREKAKRLLRAKEPPQKISERKEFYLCKWCQYRETCHA